MSETFNIYCDESCHLENDGQKAMVLGAVWCPLDKTRGLTFDRLVLQGDSGEEVPCDAAVFALGHSARDTVERLLDPVIGKSLVVYASKPDVAA